MSDATDKIVYTPGITWLDGTNPEMVAAITEAQSTFGQYREELLRDASRLVPVVEDSGVKVFFPSPTNPRAGEHMWVNDVEFDGEEMRATLRNDPERLLGLSEGDRVSFDADRVSDWFFVIDGVVRGGFTIKIVIRGLTPEQFAMYRDAPPACYFADWYADLQSNPNS